MSGKDRITMFPSRANHVLMKTRIVSATKGLSLLKRKRDALELKLREILAKRAEISQDFDRMFSEAIFSIAKANFLETDFKPATIIGSDRADACMRLTYTKTIGLLLPTFEPVIRKSESLPLTGLSHGGKQVDVIRDQFQELLRSLILIASYDYSLKILKDSIRTNSMRLNGLEYVVIPRFVNTTNYIRDELDEMEREEFYRLKRSQAKQKALKEEEILAKMPKKLKKIGEESEEDEDDDDDENGDEGDEVAPIERMVPLPISIFWKKKSVSAAQTIITGHFPGSQELISPTDSIISGVEPHTIKRSSFQVYNKEIIVSRMEIPENMRMKKKSKTVSMVEQENYQQAGISRLQTTNLDDFCAELEQSGTATTVPAESTLSLYATPKATEILDPLNATSRTKFLDTPTAPLNTADHSVINSLALTIRLSPVNNLEENAIATSTAAPSNTIVASNENVPSNVTVPSDATVPSTTTTKPIDKQPELGVQTDITGRFPRDSEMINPLFTGATNVEKTESQPNVNGGHGKSSNTDTPNNSEENETESENNSNKK